MWCRLSQKWGARGLVALVCIFWSTKVSAVLFADDADVLFRDKINYMGWHDEEAHQVQYFVDWFGERASWQTKVSTTVASGVPQDEREQTQDAQRRNQCQVDVATAFIEKERGERLVNGDDVVAGQRPHFVSPDVWKQAVQFCQNVRRQQETLLSFGPEQDENKEEKEASMPLNVHFVYSVDTSDYMAWQIVALERSFARIGQRGELTRLVAVLDEHQTQAQQAMTKDGSNGVVNEQDIPLALRTSSPNAVTASDTSAGGTVAHVFQHEDVSYTLGKRQRYTAFNKPYGIQQWLHVREKEHPDDEVIVIVDADMLFVRQWDTETMAKRAPTHLKGKPVAAEYGYLEVHGATNGLAEKYCHPKEPATRPDAVGVPYVIMRSDLRSMVDGWWTKTVAMRRDARAKALTGDGGWTVEMYAYAFAAAEAGLQHQIHVDALMLYPPYGYRTSPPYLLHYGIGFQVLKTAVTHEQEQAGAMRYWGDDLVTSFDKHEWADASGGPLDCNAQDWFVRHMPSIPPLYHELVHDRYFRGDASEVGHHFYSVDEWQEGCVTMRGRVLASLAYVQLADAFIEYRREHCTAEAFANAVSPSLEAEVKARLPVWVDQDRNNVGRFWRTVDDGLKCVPCYDCEQPRPRRTTSGRFAVDRAPSPVSFARVGAMQRAYVPPKEEL